MEKRVFLFKVLIILFSIYFIVAIGAFFKCYKQATADDYKIAPNTVRFYIPTVEDNRVLPKLGPDFSPNSTYGRGMTQRNARGFREI